ncbi:MAG TPA: hypothetical protein DCX89_04220 [Saprospirales bacterium]|nr:hypothetical protein [Saprospirales bacterium]HAY71072.1 hypothetical protein [Saprospirales bacterium]HRQ30223.1 hypothetical protein [Saprospiraceae bacterium]
METVVLKSDSKENLKLLTDLARKIGIKVKFLTKEEAEDIGLLTAILTGRTGEYVDTDVFIESLKK